jgi:signal transduction histidine kinase/CheY-like chemotaxis protein
MTNTDGLFSIKEREIYEKLPIASAFFLLNDNYHFQTVLISDGMCKLFNVKREYLIGKIDTEICVLVHNNDLKKVLHLSNNFATKKTNQYNINFRNFDKLKNKYTWIHAEGYSVNLDNNSEVTMVIYHDIDSFIKNQNKHIVEQEKTLSLEKSNEIKSEFLAKMSHDMRTPLGSIISTANFGIEEIQDEKAKQYYKQIKNSSAYLLSIMNDILDMQNYTKNKLILEPKVFELRSINETIKNIVLPKILSKKIHLTIHNTYSQENKYIKIDQAHLEQILINILNNAIKYTPENGNILLESSLINESNKNYLQYIIKDDGIGISTDFQKHMFEPFTRGTNIDSNIPGTGLGLAIVKKIITEVEGIINCDSKPGEGTCFTIKIPIPTIENNEIVLNSKKAPPKYETGKLNNKKILLVEDIKINSIIATKILESFGVIVFSVINGKEAVKEVKEHSYDLVLMDIRMPIMNGFIATEKIRMFNSKIPIIALSANVYDSDKQKAIAAGMNDHIAKPIDKKYLYDIICKYLF